MQYIATIDHPANPVTQVVMYNIRTDGEVIGDSAIFVHRSTYAFWVVYYHDKRLFAEMLLVDGRTLTGREIRSQDLSLYVENPERAMARILELQQHT